MSILQIYSEHSSFMVQLLSSCFFVLVKDNLGDLSSSDNYNRAIAKSSLILKLFDWIVLLTQGEKLSSDELQFGYQKLSSTDMCTWTAASIIGHFNRAGNDVFGALLDCSKAFDMVEWVTLFQDLIKSCSLFIRSRVLM